MRTASRSSSPRPVRSSRAPAVAKLREALALWRGPALADFAYDDFARHEIDRLEELRLGGVERRIDLELALGHHDDLVPELEALVRALSAPRAAARPSDGRALSMRPPGRGARRVPRRADRPPRRARPRAERRAAGATAGDPRPRRLARRAASRRPTRPSGSRRPATASSARPSAGGRSRGARNPRRRSSRDRADTDGQGGRDHRADELGGEDRSGWSEARELPAASGRIRARSRSGWAACGSRVPRMARSTGSIRRRACSRGNRTDRDRRRRPQRPRDRLRLVWVANGNDGTVTRINPRGGSGGDDPERRHADGRSRRQSSSSPTARITSGRRGRTSCYGSIRPRIRSTSA